MLPSAVVALTASAVVGVAPAPIIGGEPTDDHAAVVALLDEDGRPYCTGARIAPDLVLTAAHCVVQGGVELVPAAVFFGARTVDAGERVAADAVWWSPSYEPGVLVADLGLVRISDTLGAPPLPWPPGEPAAPTPGDLLGRELELVGFGHDLAGEPGTKRRVLAAVTLDDGDVVRYDDGSCYGDSGGPAFLAGTSPPELVAVISSGRLDCSGGRAVRLDPWRDELAAGVAALAADDGGCRVTPGGGPPAATALAALGAALTLGLRRRVRRLGQRPTTPSHGDQS